MSLVYHYSPDLFNLLVDTIPLLCRSKRDVLTLFRGAGVPASDLEDLEVRVSTQADAIRKYEIARTVLTRLNDKGDARLRARRELLRRVVEFEDFSTCWPGDQLKAKGLVAEIRRLVNIKDSFTRMQLERDEERKRRLAEQQAKADEHGRRRAELSCVLRDLHALFRELDATRRGKLLESVLNRLFSSSGILVREAFTLSGVAGEGIVEQIDGVVQIDGEFYLVEMKWWNEPLGVGEVSQHLVRLHSRSEARGIFISALGFTEPAITTCRDALQSKVVVLCKLEELVLLLEQERDLRDFLREKIAAAIIDRKPLYEPLKSA